MEYRCQPNSNIDYNFVFYFNLFSGISFSPDSYSFCMVILVLFCVHGTDMAGLNVNMTFILPCVQLLCCSLVFWESDLSYIFKTVLNLWAQRVLHSARITPDEIIEKLSFLRCYFQCNRREQFFGLPIVKMLRTWYSTERKGWLYSIKFPPKKIVNSLVCSLVCSEKFLFHGILALS